ncbi:hypothetical protein J3Q64DRAFT_1363281 [Phycomyces blakesleeanus]|uniref:Uncharacterized protein n=1 Tax=Phycomyces blakesleeanus TaxID=4837 RepID=A0ABR3AM12_PHYBL
MSVDNINVSLSRLALAKAIKTPDAGEDESEPWTNSVIFHQSHIDSNMRNTILGGPQKHRPHPDRARSNQQQYQQQQHHQQQYQQNQNQQYRSQYNNRNDPRKNSPVPRVTRPPQEPISARQSGMSAMPHDNSRRPLPTITGKYIHMFVCV